MTRLNGFSSQNSREGNGGNSWCAYVRMSCRNGVDVTRAVHRPADVREGTINSKGLSPSAGLGKKLSSRSHVY